MNSQDTEIHQELDSVMTEFGATVFVCQLFENSLCLMLALLSEEQFPSQGEVFSATWDFHSKNTLGRLVQELKNQVELPEDFESFLRRGVDMRNDIVHGFMPRNMLRIWKQKERTEVVEELSRIRSQIRERDLIVVRLIDTLIAKHGLTTELLKERAAGLWEVVHKARCGPQH